MHPHRIAILLRVNPPVFADSTGERFVQDGFEAVAVGVADEGR